MTREIDLSVLDVYAGLPELTVEANLNSVTSIGCRNCGQSMDGEEVECPSCGTINLSRSRRRQVENRPERSVAAEIESGNYNGKYQVFRNSDGSYSCNCLSFLFQRGVQNGVGFATCKHVRDHLNSNPSIELSSVKKPSQWQNAALKRFGVSASGYLTDAQAYFLFHDLLSKQGVEYREYEGLLREHLNVNLLPIYSFGVEFEMLTRNKQELERKLNEQGLPAYQTGYDHSRTNSWKIGYDSSVRVESGYESVEIVSPKLFGAHGFDTVKRVLAVTGETGTKVNASCGFHVHVDAWNWDTNLMLELAKVWAKIEIPVLWYLVSPSRRGNSFCKPLEVDDLIMLAEGTLSDRYHSLNLCAFQRHKTVEFRLHNGTSEAQKAIPWVVFCLMLTNAVTKGLRSREIEPAFDGVMDAIGMNESATSVIREARNYLQGRYTYWKEDAERNPSRTMRTQPIDADGFDLERELTRRRRQAERRELQRQRDTLRSSYYSRHTRFTTANQELTANSVNNLASMRPSSVISIEELEGGYDAGVWDVRSRSGDARYTVVLERETDTLVCGCRGFRTHRHCWHSINVARYIAVRRQEVEVDAQLRGFDEEEVNNQCAG